MSTMQDYSSSKLKRAILDDLSSNDPDPKRHRGENGHGCYSSEGLGDSLLALSDKFFQGIDESFLRNSIREVLQESRELANPKSEIINLFVLAFQCRWCRGGKGARLPFYQSMKFLYEIFPDLVKAVLPLIPSFGYWKDLLLMLSEVKDRPVAGVDYQPLYQAVWETYAQQLAKDYKLLQEARADNSRPSVSFAGKYAPREHKVFDTALHAVSNISKLLVLDGVAPKGVMAEAEEKEEDGFVLISSGEDDKSKPSPQPAAAPVVACSKQRYRQIVSALTAAVDVPEVKMCANRFGDINIEGVPSKCLTRNFKAFGNEALEGYGARCPGNPDRELCKQHLIECAISKKLKGAQNYPHEYVERVMRGSCSPEELLVINAQWESLRESLVAMVETEKTDALARDVMSDLETLGVNATQSTAAAVPSPGLSLSHLVPLCDVSGSMSGTPMAVAIGLGIMCSELCHESFRDMVLTFSSDARWEHLGDCCTFSQKVQKLEKAHWEGSTDFYRAMERISVVVAAQKLKQDEIPNLLVISDMQFDEAGGMGYYGSYGHHRFSRDRDECDAKGNQWEAAYEKIKRLFYDLMREGEQPDNNTTPSSEDAAGNPMESALTFQNMIVGGVRGEPCTFMPRS
jgi:hypothetical protein